MSNASDFGCSDEHIPTEFEDDDALLVTDDYLDELHPPALEDDEVEEYFYNTDDGDLLSELSY